MLGWSEVLGDPSSWHYLKFAEALHLSPGKHHLRMTSSADGLGLDFLILRAVP